jgi:hypothetical protein
VPVAGPAQAAVGVVHRGDVPEHGEQHVLGDSLLMAEAVADRGRGRRQREVHRVEPGARDLEQAEPRHGEGRVAEVRADDRLGRLEGAQRRGRAVVVLDGDGGGRGGAERLEAVEEAECVPAVEHDEHLSRGASLIDDP